MRDMEYLERKRLVVLKEIKPICESFNITDYDYEIKETGQTETLRVNDTRIGCSLNSIEATVQELVGYLFIATWRKRSLGAFETQVKNVIKVHWLEGETK